MPNVSLFSSVFFFFSSHSRFFGKRIPFPLLLLLLVGVSIFNSIFEQKVLRTQSKSKQPNTQTLPEKQQQQLLGEKRKNRRNGKVKVKRIEV